jgi:hypothetical protein
MSGTIQTGDFMTKKITCGAIAATLFLSGAAFAQTIVVIPQGNGGYADPGPSASGTTRGGGAGSPAINRSVEDGTINQRPSLRPGQGGAPQ